MRAGKYRRKQSMPSPSVGALIKATLIGPWKWSDSVHAQARYQSGSSANARALRI